LFALRYGGNQIGFVDLGEVSVKERVLTPLAVALALVAAGCGGPEDTPGGGTGAGDGRTRLSLVAYSTPQAVYDQVIPQFGRTEAGAGVSFSRSFGASGEQSRAVEAGLPADVVALSLEPDVKRLVDAGLVARDWSAGRHRGMVSNSVVVLAVREGNPKNIRTWDDLLDPGVEVLTPNPFTSGGAKWNLMAAYGARSAGGRDPQAGLAYLRELITEHVKVQDKSAREALQTFAGGQGDVLLAYENEAITARQNGQRLDYVVPRDTILIENPIAVTRSAKPQAKAFLDYLRSPPAQQVFAQHGYRPVERAVFERFADRFPTPPGLFTIADLGGWDRVNEQFFDAETGSVARIEEQAGMSTAK
jgi:sulfate/thiosulfate-binding protein